MHLTAKVLGMPTITTANPFCFKTLPDMALSYRLTDYEVVALPVAGGFDFWLRSTLPFGVSAGDLDSVALAVTGRQAIALVEELRLDEASSPSEARRALVRLAKLKRIREVAALG